MLQIARTIDRSTAATHYLLTVAPGRHQAPRVDAGTTGQRCCDCGLIASIGSLRCEACHMEFVRGDVDDRLLEAARASGLVPTVSEAQEILGIGRSAAGVVLLRVFGRDARAGGERRTTRRVFSE